MATRTRVYVDGFNLFYGSVKDTPYQWLDLKLLVENVFPSLKDSIERLWYFTAEVRGSKAKRQKQQDYFQALHAHIPSLRIIKGFFLRDKIANGIPVDQEKYGRERRDFYTNEEKGSDVNLAVQLVSDSYTNDFDTAVVISNDSDLVAAIKIAKSLKKRVIVLIPWHKGRKKSTLIMNAASDHRTIYRSVLKRCLLPDPVQSKQGPISKPESW